MPGLPRCTHCGSPLPPLDQDSVPCPACSVDRCITASVGQSFGWGKRFYPDGVRFFAFPRSVALKRDNLLYVCMECGHAWGDVDPAKLGRILRKTAANSGNAGGKCAKCASLNRATGEVSEFAEDAENATRLYAREMKLFSRNLSIPLASRFSACGDCGLLSCKVDPEGLRALLESTRKRLSN